MGTPAVLGVVAPPQTVPLQGKWHISVTGEASTPIDARVGPASPDRPGADRQTPTMDIQNKEALSRGAANGQESHYYNGNVDRYGHGREIGVDTVGFFVSDYQISKTAELQISSGANAGTGETTDSPLYYLGGDGPLVKGHRAYANLNETSVTVYGPDSMYIKTTLPRVFGPDNWCPVDTSHRFKTSIRAVRERLSNFGVETDLFEADITRLDICRNVETRDHLPDYEPIFDRCSFPQMELRRYEDGGYHWRNGSRQVIVYAKGAKENTVPQIQRLEYRLTQKRSVKAQVGYSSVAGLCADFDAVRRAYRSAVDQLFPKLNDAKKEDPSMLSRNSLLRLMGEAEKRTSSPYSKSLQALGLRYLKERDAEETFLTALEKYANSMAVCRYRETFDELAPLADLLSNKERTATSMLRELRNKLLD